MSGESEPQRNLRQSAMWRRLAEQCRLNGEHDLEREAMRLAIGYQQRADAALARSGNARLGAAAGSVDMEPGDRLLSPELAHDHASAGTCH